MSSNGIIRLTSLPNIDLDNKRIVNINYDYKFKKEFIKVLEEILERLNFIEAKINVA